MREVHFTNMTMIQHSKYNTKMRKHTQRLLLKSGMKDRIMSGTQQ